MKTLRRGLLRASIPLAIMWIMALAPRLTHEPADAKSAFLVGVSVGYLVFGTLLNRSGREL